MEKEKKGQIGQTSFFSVPFLLLGVLHLLTVHI